MVYGINWKDVYHPPSFLDQLITGERGLSQIRPEGFAADYSLYRGENHGEEVSTLVEGMFSGYTQLKEAALNDLFAGFTDTDKKVRILENVISQATNGIITPEYLSKLPPVPGYIIPVSISENVFLHTFDIWSMRIFRTPFFPKE